MRSGSLAFAFLVVAGLLLCALTQLNGSGVIPALEVPELAQAAAVEQVESKTEAEPVALQTRQPVRESRAWAAPPRRETAPSGAGQLHVCALDRVSGEPLEHVRLRVASPARIADREFKANAELRLSPGSYTLLALARGYEPFELPGLEISAGATSTLEPLRLQPGCGRILGWAGGDAVADRGLRAELSGSSCGFPVTSTSVPVAADGRFAFEGLVSGSYALRLVDADERTIGLPQSFELCAGQVRRVECDATPLRMLEVELVDTDGRSLAQEWGRRVCSHATDDEDRALELARVESAPPAFDCTFRAGETCIARAALQAPEPSGRSAVLYASCRRSLCCGGVRGTRVGETDDRARGEGEELRPATKSPQIQPTSLCASVGGDGIARFGGVQACESTLELSCGPLRASVAIPAARGTTHVRAELSGSTTFREYEELCRRR